MFTGSKRPKIFKPRTVRVYRVPQLQGFGHADVLWLW